MNKFILRMLRIENVDNGMSDPSKPLQESFLQARRFLKHSPVGNLFLRPIRPWILLLGPSASGKTSLLAHSGLNLQSASQQSFKSIKPTITLDWWIGEHAVFIDSPGKSILPDQENPTLNKAWQTFLQFVRRYRKPYPFNSVLLIIDVAHLNKINEDPLHPFVTQLTQKIHMLNEAHKTLPITLVITQCDKILGFNEFFSNLTSEERGHPLGFNLLDNHEDMSLQDHFEQEFNKLLVHANELLLWRLHHEQNIGKRSRIKDFPIQLECLSQKLSQLIAMLPFNQRLQLCGVYLTSAMQSEETQDFLAKPLIDAFHIKQETLRAGLTTKELPLFITKLFAKISDNTDFPIAQSWNIVWQRLLALPLAAIVIIGLTLLWHSGYQDNIAALRIMAKNIEQPQKESPPWLARLNTLNKTAEELKQHSAHSYRWTGLHQAASLQSETEAAYETALRNSFPNYLTQDLVSNIQNNIQRDKLNLYNTLRIYLILTQPNHFNGPIIQQWFSSQWATKLSNNPEMQRQLNLHLNNLLHLKNITWKSDPLLIQQAQAVLKELPLANIAYLELQNNYPTKPVAIIDNPNTLLGVDLSHTLISSFFLSKNFNAIYEQQIPEIAKSVIKGDWVMGHQEGQIIEKNAQEQLIANMRKIYTAQYVKAWQAVLPTIKIAHAKNLTDVATSINLLSNTNSPFAQLLKLITTNASLNPQTSNSTLLDFLEHKGDFNKIQNVLMNLSGYLNNVAGSSSIDKSSYDLAASRLAHQGSNDAISALYELSIQIKPPMNSWLKAIADNSWRVLLNNSKNYLNTIWQTMIVPTYTDTIKSRYPIFNDASQEISLENFTHFFGPNGSLNNFFNYYLKPFVDLSNKYWTFQKMNGMSIDIPQEVLENFIRGSLIQRMFFTDAATTPQIQWTLEPAALSQNSALFTLSVEGQMIQFTRDAKQNYTLTWPGPTPGLVTMNFTGNEGDIPPLTLRGNWAWLRLISQSQLTLGKTAKQFVITFRSGPYSATFNLTANNVINPYLPNILYKFRCPDSL